MSADNYLFIDRKKKPIEVWACVASLTTVTTESYEKKNLEGQKVSLIGKAETLEEALKMAEDYEKELESNGSYVECGISFKLWAK